MSMVDGGISENAPSESFDAALAYWDGLPLRDIKGLVDDDSLTGAQLSALRVVLSAADGDMEAIRFKTDRTVGRAVAKKDDSGDDQDDIMRGISSSLRELMGS